MERISNSPPDLCSKIRRPKISTPYLLCFLGERSTKIPGTSPSGCLPRLRPHLAQFRSLTVQCKSLPDRGHMCIESTDSALPSRWTRPVIHIYFSASVRQAGRSAQVAPYKYADTPTVTDATDSAILSIVASYVDDCTASFAEPTVPLHLHGSQRVVRTLQPQHYVLGSPAPPAWYLQVSAPLAQPAGVPPQPVRMIRTESYEPCRPK